MIPKLVNTEGPASFDAGEEVAIEPGQNGGGRHPGQ
jgi:hypothetical protein